MNDVKDALALRSALSRLLLNEVQYLLKTKQIVLDIPGFGRVVVRIERDGG